VAERVFVIAAVPILNQPDDRLTDEAVDVSDFCL
jgi:hypothetical protein